MNKELIQVSISTSFLRAKPTLMSNITSECLFGETFKVEKKFENWSYGTLLTDNYKGWIKSCDLNYCRETSHRVIANSTIIFSEKNIKTAFMTIYLGSQVSIIKEEKEWTKIFLNKFSAHKYGYILTKDLTNLKSKNQNWVAVAENLINSPYFWGGRSLKGIDCSALIQLSLQTSGVNFPRDSYKQENMDYFSLLSIDLIKRGDLVFWDGHVGVMQDSVNIIHSNAFHGKVFSEPLKILISRIEKKVGPIKKILRIK